LLSSFIQHDLKLSFTQDYYADRSSSYNSSENSTSIIFGTRTRRNATMAPSATEVQVEVPIHPGKAGAAKPWVKSTGALEQYESFDVTPVIGREFPHANLVTWLKAPNSDELLRELALTSMS
jgi:hypothetical protein